MLRRQVPWPRAEDATHVVDPSPGPWTPPRGVLPGWDWTPPGGLRLRPQDVPLWVRAWLAVPLVDRCAHVWMWHHGWFSLVPEPPGPPGGGGGSAGDREPRRPLPQPPALHLLRRPDDGQARLLR